LDLSGTFEGAGGIGGLLARSHDFTLCTNMLTVRMTNGSPYLVEVWLYHSDTAVDFYQGNGWWLVPDLANAEVYAEAVQVPPDDYRDFTFEAVGGREYDLYGHGDYYYVQEFYVPITATLENYQVGLVPLGNDLDWSYGESGNVLCGEDLTGRWLTHTYYHADGNGNITCLVNANQAVVASYRYDPYGNTLAQSGPLAEANTYRFSSKEFHAASGLYYYGYRFYDPRMQRWMNRDPGEELDGLNLYTFVHNEPVEVVDPYGFQAYPPVFPPPPKQPRAGGPVWNPKGGNPDRDNCLGYGLGTGGMKQPDGGDGTKNAVNCLELMQQITDNWHGRPPGKGGCPPGCHAITVTCDGNGGFHVMRQDSGGGWSEMSINPSCPPRRCKTSWLSDAPISGIRGSGTPCGELCVPN